MAPNNMGWGNTARGHKKTMSCPQAGCNYTSRQFVVEPSFMFNSDKKRNKLSNESRHCPFHNQQLIYIPEVNHPQK